MVSVVVFWAKRVNMYKIRSSVRRIFAIDMLLFVITGLKTSDTTVISNSRNVICFDKWWQLNVCSIKKLNTSCYSLLNRLRYMFDTMKGLLVRTSRKSLNLIQINFFLENLTVDTAIYWCDWQKARFACTRGVTETVPWITWSFIRTSHWKQNLMCF